MERGPALMIAMGRRSIARGCRRDRCVLDCLLMGGPFLALPMAVGHNGVAVDTHQHRPVYVAR